MNKYKFLAGPFLLWSLAGCGGMNSYLNNTQQTVEIYHIFDIKTSADTTLVAKAATEGLSRNTNSITSVLPLQLDKKVAAQPARFKIEDLSATFGGSAGAMMKMAAAQGGSMGTKVANCEGSVWSSKAKRTITGSSDLTLYSCLYKYKGGYNLDVYAIFSKQEGGMYQISQSVANSMVGTPEEWVNKTIVDTVSAIEKATAAKIVYLEGQPDINNLPWHQQ